MNTEGRVIPIYRVRNPEEVYLEIYHAYYVRVKEYASKFFRIKEDAEDAVQNVFMRLWEKKEKICAIASVENYLFIMVKNEFINKRRSYMNRRKIIQGYTNYIETRPATNLLVTEQEVSFRETARIISLAIHHLPPQMKTVMVLRREGYTKKEISVCMGIGRDTVKEHMRRGVRRMEGLLKVI